MKELISSSSLTTRLPVKWSSQTTNRFYYLPKDSNNGNNKTTIDPKNINLASDRTEHSTRYSPQIKITLHEILLPNWEIREPLILALEQDEDDFYIISDNIFNEYGTGETYQEALQDYLKHLFSFYHLLVERSNDNRPENQALLEKLQRYLSYKGA